MRPLEFIFQDSKVARMLDFLILFRDFSYTYNELLEKSGLYYDAVFAISHLKDIGLIIHDIKTETEQDNGLYYYKLNKSMAKTLIRLHYDFIEYNMKKMD